MDENEKVASISLLYEVALRHRETVIKLFYK